MPFSSLSCLNFPGWDLQDSVEEKWMSSFYVFLFHFHPPKNTGRTKSLQNFGTKSSLFLFPFLMVPSYLSLFIIFFFFFWARRGRGDDRPGHTWPTWPSLYSSVFMMSLWIPSRNGSLMTASLQVGLPPGRQWVLPPQQQREEICAVTPRWEGQRECATLATTALVVTKAPWQCVNKGHVKSHKGQCVGL